MKSQRRKYSASFKAKVALEALQDTETLATLSRRHKINANMVSKWKRQLVENVSRVFEAECTQSDATDREAELLQKIGELTVERDFLSKGLGRSR